ncbi:Vhr1p NDAI_0A02490 [Naumovozyma dairenensis CBS 421]|uniref:Transcription factor VHR1 n=1 Tax=Naumovozyma dairenensis (strain ATCC 10597 / BCRC 20456 / CBS 421 / NBRC 0211 / NRRL Y-12639) TaxID=1071378 RepID=G0W3L9_NAUDC|nr:hypothetical protein NDAI_0A02490 [Naumovozyma dairenensis CBS 421]CCD22407.1 hypothetical protein NDAI_0A02490 [Naumovozyma dairenensis CBS 421]
MTNKGGNTTTKQIREILNFNDELKWKQFSSRRLELIDKFNLSHFKASEQDYNIKQIATILRTEFGYPIKYSQEFEKLVTAAVQSVRRNRKRSRNRSSSTSSNSSGEPSSKFRNLSNKILGPNIGSPALPPVQTDSYQPIQPSNGLYIYHGPVQNNAPVLAPNSNFTQTPNLTGNNNTPFQTFPANHYNQSINPVQQPVFNNAQTTFIHQPGKIAPSYIQSPFRHQNMPQIHLPSTNNAAIRHDDRGKPIRSASIENLTNSNGNNNTLYLILTEIIHNTIPLAEQAKSCNYNPINIIPNISEFPNANAIPDQKTTNHDSNSIPFFLREKILIDIQRSRTCLKISQSLATNDNNINSSNFNLLTLGELAIKISTTFVIERFFEDLPLSSTEYITSKIVSLENLKDISKMLFGPATRYNLSQMETKILYLLLGGIVKDFGFDPTLYPLSEIIYHIIMTRYPLGSNVSKNTSPNSSNATTATTTATSNTSNAVVQTLNGFPPMNANMALQYVLIPPNNTQTPPSMNHQQFQHRNVIMSSLPMKPQLANQDVNKKVILKFKNQEQNFVFPLLSNSPPTIIEILENSKNLFKISNPNQTIGIFCNNIFITDDYKLSQLFNTFTHEHLILELRELRTLNQDVSHHNSIISNDNIKKQPTILPTKIMSPPSTQLPNIQSPRSLQATIPTVPSNHFTTRTDSSEPRKSTSLPPIKGQKNEVSNITNNQNVSTKLHGLKLMVSTPAKPIDDNEDFSPKTNPIALPLLQTINTCTHDGNNVGNNEEKQGTPSINSETSKDASEQNPAVASVSKVET